MRILQKASLALLSLTFVGILSLFILSSPVTTYAYGTITTEHGLVVVSGYVEVDGHPSANAFVSLERPTYYQTSGTWKYLHIASRYTNRAGYFIMHPKYSAGGTYFLWFRIPGSHGSVRKYLKLVPGHDVRFKMVLSNTLDILSFPVFVY